MAKQEKLSFGWERLELLLTEPSIRDLLTAYWEELSPIPHLKLDMDWAFMLAQERAGIYRIWTARVNATLAGFVSFYVKTHPYFRTVLFAVDGGHFLDPAFRNGQNRLGWRMWTSAKAALLEEGVQVCMLHDNALRPLSPFFIALGAHPFSSMWIWDLRDEDHD